jgi:pyrimidine-nucleoside phosphorylase
MAIEPFDAVDLIRAKRDGGTLSTAQIGWLIDAYTRGYVADEQMSAMTMAIFLNGMGRDEIRDLTLAMVASGRRLDFSGLSKRTTDKHSTGGVGDKITLPLAPLVASFGVAVPQLSGRGLGHTGGTLDKLESIPGWRAALSPEEFMAQLESVGAVVCAAGDSLAPADGKLYGLRDITGTVESIPLIASSIMSKKIAAGAHAVVLDVKVGLGAFMHTLDEARQLAAVMVSIGELVGRRVATVLSDMNQPLGCAVGNALEVREAIDTLHGGGPPSFREHCLHVSTLMLVLGELTTDLSAARTLAERALDDGSAWQKFRSLVAAQGGDLSFVDNPDKLPKAKYVEVVNASRNGYLDQVHARIVGEASVTLGAGRAKKGDPIDHAVGLVIHHKVGDRVEKGQPLFTVHANDVRKQAEVKENVLAAHRWNDIPVAPLPLFYE